MASPADHARLAAALDGVGPQELAVVLKASRTVTLVPRQRLFDALGGPPTIVFVIAGFLRELYATEDGRDVTRMFVQPGEFAANAFDAPEANVDFAALTDARVFAVGWSEVVRGAAMSPAIRANVDREVTAAHRRLLEREHRYATLSAREHYLYLRRTQSWIEDHARLYEIASYLRITPEHLSRIRRAL
jgi:CRP-like cAMP-binding protein